MGLDKDVQGGRQEVRQYGLWFGEFLRATRKKKERRTMLGVGEKRIKENLLGVLGEMEHCGVTERCRWRKRGTGTSQKN